MLTKRQFLTFYDQSVAAIRQIKLYNDKLNKKLGVTNMHALLRQNEVENEVVDNISAKVEQMINKMEKSYLDPQTARKIGTIKQQFRNQSDRRKVLVESLKEMSAGFREQKKLPNKAILDNRLSRTFQMEANTFNSQHYEQEQASEKRESNWNKKSQITDIETTGSNSQVLIEDSFDYEMQRKIMSERSKELGETHSRIVQVKGIMDQTSQLVNNQGDMLDIIGDDLFTTYRNAQGAAQQITQANKNQRKFRKKMCVLIIFILIALAISSYAFFQLI